MGCRLRKIGKGVRKAIVPLVLAAFVPLISTSFALPRNPGTAQPKPTDPSSRISKRKMALRLSASIDINDGKTLVRELCGEKFEVLYRRHKTVHRRNEKKSETDLITGLKWDMQVMGEVITNPRIYSKKDKLRIVLSSMRSNQFILVKLSKTRSDLVRQYLQTASCLHPSLAKAYGQSFNNPDVDKLYRKMFKAVCE